MATRLPTVALVTGAASGIGRSLARGLARRGTCVVLADRDAEGLATVAAELRGQNATVDAHELDVTDAEAFEAVVAHTFDERGRLDALFNNAGIGVGETAARHTLEDWQRVLDVNVRGVVHGIHAAYPRMVEQGSGHIINTASVAGLVPMGLMTSYVASKHAVVGLSLSLRIEAAEHGVDVTALCPGVIRTAIIDGGRYGRVSDDYDKGAVRRLFESLSPADPDAFADRVLDRLQRAPAILVEPRRYWLAWWLQRTAPGPMSALHGWLYRRARRQALRGVPKVS